MSFNYKPLFKLLIDKDMSKEDLRKTISTSSRTITKMNKGEYVALEVLDRICSALRAPIQNVIEHEPETGRKEGTQDDD